MSRFVPVWNKYEPHIILFYLLETIQGLVYVHNIISDVSDVYMSLKAFLILL